MRRSPPIADEVDVQELEDIMARARGVLSEHDCSVLEKLIRSYCLVTESIESKNASIARLRQMLFGSSSEVRRALFPANAAHEGRPAGGPLPPEVVSAGQMDVVVPPHEARERARGHGRNGAADYPNATVIDVRHADLAPKDTCPGCKRGKLYHRGEPGVLLRVTGQAMLHASLYRLEKLRCNACGETYTADPPAGVGSEKYDARAAAMIGLLRYGSGLPWNRIEKLQASFETPVPASTQWEIVEGGSRSMEPAYDELVRRAAQGELLHNDDTPMTILSLMGQDPANAPRDPDRKGVFTSGVVAKHEGHDIALFCTGRRHAGENLAVLLHKRAEGLSPPIQMCDALSRNLPKDLSVVLAHCLVHARRHFVQARENFPEECRHVIDVFANIYANDEHARKARLTPEGRLQHHQAYSKPLLEGLATWFDEQLAARRIEPNSGLGGAIAYMKRHWEKLTLFLRVPGAPLDNNVCERALKKAILHRKNSWFYKTENGARVGDIYMSLIHTAELCGANAFDYLASLIEHEEEVRAQPEKWLPWNYTDRRETLSGPGPGAGNSRTPP